MGVIAVGVLVAVFIPLTFDPTGAPTGIALVQLNRTDVILISTFDNFEWAGAEDFVTHSSNTPKSSIELFDNYRLSILRFKDSVTSPPFETAHWTSAIPPQFDNSSATVNINLYWYKNENPTGSGGGNGTCWNVGLAGVSQFEPLNIPTFSNKTSCVTTNNELDTLFIEEFMFNATEHNLATRDWVSVLIGRDVFNPIDDYNKETNFLGVRIIWESDESG